VRYECQRCGATLHHNDPPHLCKDVAARLAEYRQKRRSRLLRIIRGVRCPEHGTVLQIVCGTKACGTCWIEQPFRAPKALGKVEWVPQKFSGHGKGGEQGRRMLASAHVPEQRGENARG
jgi:hypothetical protein